MKLLEKLRRGHEKEPEPTPLVATELDDEQTVSLDLSEPIKNDSYGFSKELYPYGNLVTIIDAGGKIFGLADLRSGSRHLVEPKADFLLIDEAFNMKKFRTDEQEHKKFKAIRQGKPPVLIGRQHHAERFDYPDTTSRNQLEIAYQDGRLRIHDLGATNPTTIYSVNPPRPEVDVLGGRTVLAIDRAERTAAYGKPTETSPYGSFMNHPIIGKDIKSVENGVYLGGSSREAIVVDSSSETLQSGYSELLGKLHIEKPQTMLSYLDAINQFVQTTMPYNGDKVGEITASYHGDKLIGLSEFIRRKAGVCRHQALLASHYLERLIKEGYLVGQSHVQRNTVPDYGGTHAWATFTDQNGYEYVIDPAQNFVGTKEVAKKLPGKWEYYISQQEKPIM